MNIISIVKRHKSGNNRMPFGKYKGISIRAISIKDSSYLEWLMTQGWFKNKFSYLHNALIELGYRDYSHDPLPFFDTENIPF